MNAVQLLCMDAQVAHQNFEGTTADVMDEHAHHGPQANAPTVASAMAHVVFAEDNIIQGLIQGKPPLATTTFAGKMGISDPQFAFANTPEWVKSVRLNLPQFREYMKAVFAATDQYLATLSEADLDRTVDLSQYNMGVQTVGWMLVVMVIGHLHDITGEISALKGAQGLKGYPF